MKRHLGLFVVLALASGVLLAAGCGDKSTSLSGTEGGGVAATATAVGIGVCHNCHADSAVNAVRIFDGWASSRHGNSNTVPPTNYFGEPPGECNGCHDPNGDSLNLGSYSGPGSSATARNVIGCEACHGGGSLHFGIGPIGGPTLGAYAKAATAEKSSQYNTCTGCHSESDSPHDPSRPFGTVDEIIYDTHYDNAARAVGSDLQGYVIRRGADTACVDCHNPHTASLDINRQWKGSAHGDFAGAGWKNYRWTDSSRASCQRCHTVTGAVNYLTGPATYDPAKNVFSWLVDPAADNRSEMLYCYGCHTNYFGGLRTPGPITAVYTGVMPEPVFPDVEGSNICLACHTGRENGDSIKASTVDFANSSFINSHYLTAGATLFGVSGYEYDTLAYTNLPYFEHDKIGTTAAPGTGANGPCVGCHMSSTLNPKDPAQGKHRFLNVGLDNTGAGEIITTPVCAVCHTPPYTMTIEELNVAEEEASAGLRVLDNVLRKNNYFFADRYPYFFKTADNTATANAVKDWTRRYDGSAGDNTIGKRNMGAAFNYNLFEHDPGFFAHNNHYVKLLIYDSIDWLDDNQMNNSAQDYINANIADPATKSDALTFFGAAGRP